EPLLRPVSVGVLRKKATGVRQWLVLDSEGNAEVVEAGKHAIMRRTGLPARDLRILDPLLSYPSTVLGRDHAIVINMEHIKAIITAEEVLLLNSRDPSVVPFVDEIQKRILRHKQAVNSQENPDGPRLLPFEFIALEACLEAACGCLETEATTLELEAHPALDKLTSQISTLNLERVRQIKSRLVAITGRVQKVRDELEHLLDDDQDMADMYLTDKLHEQHENSSITSSMNGEDDDMEDDAETDDRHVKKYVEQTLGASTAFSRGSHQTHMTLQSGITKRLNVEELEILLEAYFVQAEGILSKMSTLREYVDDTEDYINIMLDDKQNQLLQMGITLTTATLVITVFIVVAGAMGMNIRIGLFNNTVDGNKNFILTIVVCSAGCLVMFLMAISWCKHKGLLE
ncbi:hypothetical protein M569_05248, partial [Genlisea aurea]